MRQNVLLSVMLVAATGLLGGCDSIDFLNPFSPDKVDLQPLFAELVPNQTWTVGTAVHLSLPAAERWKPAADLRPLAGPSRRTHVRRQLADPHRHADRRSADDRLHLYRHRRRRRYRVDPVPGQRGRGIHRSLT